MMRWFTLILFIMINASCARLNLYSSGSHETDIEALLNAKDNYEPLIRVEDKISISIWNHENLSVGSVYGIYNSNEVFGKWLLVSPDSTITLPKIGAVKLAGQTMDEARKNLTNHFSQFIVNPVIDIKIHSHQVSVIGAVISPGNYTIYRSKNTLASLIAQAGGIDFYADLRKTKLVRGKVSYQLDLTEMTSNQMDNIILLPDDVLYLPVRGGKSLDKKTPLLLAIASIATTFLILISSFKN